MCRFLHAIEPELGSGDSSMVYLVLRRLRSDGLFTLKSVTALRRLGFDRSLAIKALRHAQRSQISAEPGVYLYLRTIAAAPEFLV